MKKQICNNEVKQVTLQNCELYVICMEKIKGNRQWEVEGYGGVRTHM